MVEIMFMLFFSICFLSHIMSHNFVYWVSRSAGNGLSNLGTL
jgi:hypothetical protein